MNYSDKLNEREDLLFAGFNQDFACFAVGTDEGFIVYNCDPLKERFRRDFGGGVQWVEMLFRCNILALIGGGKDPKWPPNKVIIWDDYQDKCIVELEFRSDVKAVRLRRDKIVVVLEHKIYVYNFSDVRLLQSIETISNPRGICAICPNTQSSVLACPGLQRGYVHVELFDENKTTIIPAHDSGISQISLSIDGSRLATASEKGTLVRVWDTSSGQLLQELRRGADRCTIYSLAFSHDADWLCLSSDKGTVHVFALNKGGDLPPNSPQMSPKDNGAGPSNPKSSLSFMKGILPKYFSSQWSFCQFYIPNESKAVVSFGTERNVLIVVCADGSYHKCVFDPIKGGEIKESFFAKFLPVDYRKTNRALNG